jgi:hypothetical protein
MSLTSPLNAQNIFDNKSPYSGGLLAAKAVRDGLVKPQSGGASQNGTDLTCGTVPCVFAPVQVSGGGQMVDEDPIVASPINPLHLLSAGNDYNCSNIQGFYASNDGGSTWNHTCSPGTNGLGDPIVGYDLKNVAYAGGIQGTSIVAFISTDNGGHWSNPITVTKAVQSGGQSDNPWMEIDTHSGSPFKNRIYVSSTQFGGSSGSNSEIAVSHSTDGGHHWVTKVVDTLQIYPGMVDQFSDLAIGSDGTVYVNWIRCPTTGPTGDCGGTLTNIMFSKSTDGGTTWSPPTVAATTNMAPDSCGAFYGCLPNTSERVSNIPSNAAFGSGATATVYVSMYNWTGTQMQIQVAKSTDGGATFGAPVRVTKSTKGDEFFHWINLTADGKRLEATWLDRRNDPSNFMYQPFVAVSSDGVLWRNSTALTSKLSDPSKDGFFGSFMGDYYTSIWVGRSVYSVWPDTNSGIIQDTIGGTKLF